MYGTPMYRLTRKLRSVKNRLKAFNFHVFANVQEKVVEARGNYLALRLIFYLTQMILDW